MNGMKFYYSLFMVSTAYIAAYPALIPGENPEQVFTTIFDQNLWGDNESKSGGGSTFEATDRIRESLPQLLKGYRIKSMLDVSCGDFNWLRAVSLGKCSYIGMDIVENAITKNRELYANHMRTFKHGNAITDELPKVDLILCRDTLVHFDLDTIFTALRNFKRSGSKYLLVTVQPHTEQNHNITMGQWRPLNLQKAPFNFPAPICLLPDREHGGDQGMSKYLGLWLIQDLPV